MIRKLRKASKDLFDILFNKNIRKNILEAIPFWIASLLTGLIAVLYSRLFSFSELLPQMILSNRNWLIFILSPTCFAIAWYIIYRLAPGARGSGIPQVIASIELLPKYEKKVSTLLGLKVVFVKILSSMFMIIGGGAIGREGPTIQIAGSIFRLVNKWTPISWPRLSQKNFILTGAAAGLAAAFNTPLGGIVFAIEELAKIHISHFRTALFTAIIIAGLTAQAFLGSYLYLGYPMVSSSNLFVFPMVVLVAIISGIIGSLMCRMTLKLMHFKQAFNVLQSLLFAVFIGLIVASVAYFLTLDIIGSGKNIMNQVLFKDYKHLSFETVLARVVGPILSYNVGGAGGIFAPSLSAGASVGAFFSYIFDFAGPDANILILSGMVAFLTGVTRTPFTSAILVLEMTDRHGMIFHLMLAAMVANIASLAIDKKSFYDNLKEAYVQEAKYGKV